MPFLLPRSISSDEIAFVLTFGNLSNLEICTVGKEVSRLEMPCERVSVATLRSRSLAWVPRLAGVHKAAPLVGVMSESLEPRALIEVITQHFDEIPTLSVSSYGVQEEEHEILVRAVLDGFRSAGFRKTRLLRPKGEELMADEVLTRRAFDVVAFRYRNGYALGPTSWVPDSAPLRYRGVRKPEPHPEISLSPRLASLLVNLAGLSPGQVLLDPFCGSGTILAEALLRAYRCLGVDSSESKVRHARSNLGWAAAGLRRVEYDVRLGDARNLKEMLGRTKVDAVVSEPLLIPSLVARPRVETATELVEGAGEVYADSLASIAEVVSPGGRIVMVVPVVPTMEGRDVSISLDGKPLGLRLYQPGPIRFEYPIRLSFESTRWVRRGVYVFETAS